MFGILFNNENFEYSEKEQPLVKLIQNHDSQIFQKICNFYEVTYDKTQRFGEENARKEKRVKTVLA